MSENLDPLEPVLQALRSREWKPTSHKLRLEEVLMQEFETPKTSRPFARRPWLVAAAVVLLVGGTAFATSGGFDLVRNWVVGVWIGGERVDAEVIDYQETENGAVMTLDLQEHGQACLEIVEDAEQKMVTVDLSGNMVAGDGEEITIEVGEVPAEEEGGEE